MDGTNAFRAVASLGLFVAGAAAAIEPIGALPASAIASHLTASQLVKPQSALSIALPGRTLTFATQTTSPETGMTGVRGVANAENRMVAFIWNGRLLSADVYADDGRYELVKYLGNDFWVRSSDLPETRLAEGPEEPTAAISSAPHQAPRELMDSDGRYRIDLEVLYTPGYLARFGSVESVRAEAQRLIYLANVFFNNSRMPIRYRLVGLAEYSIPDGARCDDLVTMGLPNDAYVRNLRDANGADVAVLLKVFDPLDDSHSRSASFNAREQSYPPTNVNPERDAFSCVEAAPDGRPRVARTLAVEHTFAHELGHVLGGGHRYGGPKAIPDSGRGWRPYAHAWNCGGLTTDAGAYGPGFYYTMMSQNDAYSPSGPCIVKVGDEGICINFGIGPFVGYPRGDFFSDPAVVRNGTGCGVMVVQPPLGELLQADNARAITEAAPYVAAYRKTVVP